MSWLRRLYRGRPIVVVSGLPRSGTSMAMKMLDAGGMPLVTDGVRSADISNPNGYYEFEPVKDLERGEAAWLADARGKAVKIVSPLLTYLPESFDYQVIFMRRPLAEIIDSQHAMLDARGSERGSDAARTAELYAAHLAQVERFLAAAAMFLDGDDRVFAGARRPARPGEEDPGVSRRRAGYRADGGGRRSRVASESAGLTPT